jgi:hypothetical protein
LDTAPKVVHGDNIWAVADLKKDPKKGAALSMLSRIR